MLVFAVFKNRPLSAGVPVPKWETAAWAQGIESEEKESATESEALIDISTIRKWHNLLTISSSGFLIDTDSSHPTQWIGHGRARLTARDASQISNRNYKELKTSVTPRFLRDASVSNRSRQGVKTNTERTRPGTHRPRPRSWFLIDSLRIRNPLKFLLPNEKVDSNRQ